MARSFINRQPDYSDLDLDFLEKNNDGEYYIDMIKTGDAAIKRSIRNLIFTNYYDRPFRSFIGSNVRSILFDNLSPFSASQLEIAIMDVINNFEPRVKLMTVRVDADLDRNGFNVNLFYIIKNREQPIVTTIFLERVR
jgi:phage baseplate assembly protein W